MTFSVKHGSKTQTWSKYDLESRLQKLQFANKKVEWIRKDLSTKKSNWLSRLIWKVVAKHFSWMRRVFYKVDLSRTRSTLQQLRTQIIKQKDDKLTSLFNGAVNNLNASFAKFHVYPIPSGTTESNSHNFIKDGLGYLSTPGSKNDSSVIETVYSSLEDLASYNHGKLHYDEAAKIVTKSTQKTGSFLIRESWDSDFKVATVKTGDKNYRHIRFKFADGKFVNQYGTKFSALNDLVKAEGGSLLYPVLAGTSEALDKPASSPHSSTVIPPISKTPPKPVKTAAMKYQEALDDGEDPTELLIKAYKEGQPAIAAWLIQQKGANYQTLLQKSMILQIDNEKQALLSWLETLLESKEPTPENLDHFALKLGYGYKSANLLVLQHKADKMNADLKTAKVKVPPFLPVGDYEMTDYLRKEVPEIFDLWENFLKNSFDPSAKATFLKAASNEKAAKAGLKITTEGEKILDQIKLLITKHFNEYVYQTPQMMEWLAKENPQFLIIRSTGKEDSDTNSNAGGNASIPYVEPNKYAISEAVGEVIASYFGEKSINQRILCGDRSLFEDKKPFMPILMQEMVGENLGGKGSKDEDIPRCGVLFTCQDDKAEGVTFIQTGLGNNEGVVSSQVGVDSYYVKDGKIHAVVREKETRFVSAQTPSGKMAVVPIKNNNPALEMSQALPPGVILDIKRVADNISASYAKETGHPKPMDMEYTVKLREKGSSEPVIYLLQARPLMSTEGEEKIKHSYLDLKELKAVEQKDKVSAEVLLDGNAYVRQITDPQSVIFADTLPKGEFAYSHADNPASKKVIIVKKTAPATSHEAVILRPKGVAVLVVSNPEEFAELKQRVHEVSAKKPLLVDTQRGLLVSGSTQAKAQKLIKEGLVSYPIPLEVTIPPSRLMNIPKEHKHLEEGIVKLFDLEADKLIKKLQGDNDLLPVANGKKEGYGTRELLDIMATKDEEQAKLALATLLRLMKNRLVMSMEQTDEFRKTINKPMFQVFEAACSLARREILPALETHAPQSLERLYPIKFLDAMLFQKPGTGVMGAHSYYQVLALDAIQKKAMHEAEELGIKFDGPNGQALIFLHQQGTHAYSEDCGKAWHQMVEDLAKLKNSVAQKHIAKLMPLIKEASDLGIAGTWMNTEFHKAWKKYSSKSGETRLNAVISELRSASSKNQKTFDWIKKRLGTLKIHEQGTALWGEPSHVQKNVTALQNAFVNDLGFNKAGNGSIKAVFNASDSIGRLALLQYIRAAVNTYDCIIKAVKGSDKFPSDQAKAVKISELLQGYFSMMEAVFELVPVADQQSMQKLNMGSTVLFGEYINRILNGCTYKFGFSTTHKSRGFTTLVHQIKNNLINASEQLEARPQFAVDSLVVGSKADLNFSTHWPDRLEEYFTTFHQNMEQVVKYLNMKNGLDTSLISAQAKEICDRSKSLFKQDISYMTMEEGKLQVGYQIPLRQHSANFVVAYDPQHPEKGLELKVQMFGNDERRRWDWGAAFGSIVAHLLGDGFVDGIPPQINYNKPEGVDFTVRIPQGYKDVSKLIETIHYITKKMTMDRNGKPASLIQYMQHGEGSGSSFKGIGTIDWSTLSPECYRYTLHINRTLINQLAGKGQTAAAGTVAIQSLRGLAYYGQTDYARDGSSLRLTAVQELKKLIPTEFSIHEEVQKLLDDPDIQSCFPGVCAELKVEMAKILKPEDAFAKFMKGKDYLEAFMIAKASKKTVLLSQFKAFIKEKLASSETDLLVNLVIALTGKGMESEAEELILSQGLQDMLSPQQLEKLQALKQKEVREQHKVNLNNNVQELKKLVSGFEANHKAIMKMCVNSLIGLSQCGDFQGKSFGGFSHLNGYLGNAKYGYVYDNQYTDTSKLRKAGPMYIIRGLESSNPDVRSSAVDAVKQLALDYTLFGKNEAHVEGIRLVMFALARAYMDTAHRKSTAARELLDMFQGNKAIIKQMALSDQMTASLKQALQDAAK